jgi:hypothetical protein
MIVATQNGAIPALAGLHENDVPVASTADGRGRLISRRRARDRSVVTIARLDLDTNRLLPIRTITAADPSGVRNLFVVVKPDARTVIYNIQR